MPQKDVVVVVPSHHTPGGPPLTNYSPLCLSSIARVMLYPFYRLMVYIVKGDL